MHNFPEKLQEKLEQRKAINAFRDLRSTQNRTDFLSNDYLGFASNKTIYEQALKQLVSSTKYKNGATGSRLLSGNYPLYKELESFLCLHYKAEAALVFNSGYNVNLGLFSSILQKGDIIYFDEYAHASIRDGIRLSNAKAYKFKHHKLEDLKYKLENNKITSGSSKGEIYIVTESVFSMDGDSPDLHAFCTLAVTYKARLIVDEAHAVGVFGNKGEGLLSQMGLEDQVFARIITFGKAMGCHGAALLGSSKLMEYMVNFSRSFIYTTGLPPHTLATIYSAHLFLLSEKGVQETRKLQENIAYFRSQLEELKLTDRFITSLSAIHCCIVPGNKETKRVTRILQGKGFEIRPILAPTVPEGSERIRICLHSYNSKEEIENLTKYLKLELSPL